MTIQSQAFEDIESVNDLDDVDPSNDGDGKILVRRTVSGNLEYEDRGTGLVIENRTSDPSSPVDGQIWLRTDL